MKQPQTQSQAQAQAIGLRQLTIEETVSLAYYVMLKQRCKGKTSKRVTVFLSPSKLPPAPGTYETPFGAVRLKTLFSQREGKWIVTVIFSDGFQLRDFAPSPKPSQPSPSWREYVPSAEEVREVQKILGILEE